METGALLILLLCYGLAGYAWWRLHTPVYLFTLLSGHVSALASPLWSTLYAVAYNASLGRLGSLWGQPLLASQVLAAGWYYALPALLVLFLYQVRWWFPGYLSGLLTYAVFFLYHLVIETIGWRLQIWNYTGVLPFNIPNTMLSALMSALVSLGLLYVLLAVYRYGWLVLLLSLLPTTLILSLLIHGVLGAPLWVSLLLPMAREQFWAVAMGTFSTLALLLWGIHIVTTGLRRVDQSVIA
ncbi:MAG: hypothetical protein MUD01_11450 [Chloroflexaceae bacterium]|jgi:hypothetical protein|nr:hypothetical protein [Chloroflexaceae bacterium]